jgi:hypothetical protein
MTKTIFIMKNSSNVVEHTVLMKLFFLLDRRFYSLPNGIDSQPYFKPFLLFSLKTIRSHGSDLW